MKKTIAAAVAVFLAVVTPQVVFAACGDVGFEGCGDLNADDSIVASDGLAALTLAVGLHPGEAFCVTQVQGEEFPILYTVCGDVTGDGNVRATDSVLIQRVAVQVVPASDLVCPLVCNLTSTTSTTLPEQCDGERPGARQNCGNGHCERGNENCCLCPEDCGVCPE